MRRLPRLRFSRRVCVLVCVAWVIGLELGGVGFALWRWREARAERETLEVRREALGAGSSGSITEALEATEFAREQVVATHEALRGTYGVRLVSAAPPSRSRAFFEIVQWIEHLRACARDRGVVCREDERFGFASYARQGPSLETLGRVHRQCELAGELLEALFETHPHRFERLQRDDPARAERRARAGQEEADYFAFVDEPALVLPADTEAEAFRITFVGHTRSLRAWLNHLAGMPGPVVVRDLQVEPVRTTGAAPDAMRITVTVQVFFLRTADEVLPSEAAVTQVLR